MTRDYELAFILNPEVNEEQTQAILGRVNQVVANYGGRIVKVNQWGRRRLAYPIERHRDGLYVFIDMILTPETVTELDRTLRVSEEVLRHMMKRRDPKVVQKEREDREAREAQAAAAAAAAANKQAEANVEPNAEPQDELAAPAAATGEEPVTDTASPDAQDEAETPAALSEEEFADVPPAIDEVTETE
ncbi:MAG TPA: 30S ribosomal protein S6 [Ktedonobacteraceae bacterium]|nr:30S ribosomal protein S6 [Ktedonobacteraceae bacterium]